MDKYLEQIDKTVKYMPAWWQNEGAVTRLGECGEYVFFRVEGLVISDEPIESGIRYAKKNDLLLDRQMVAATKRKRSQR